MIKKAIVFSGQGSQTAGMGKFLYENYSLARKVFETAESIRKGTIKQCFEGSKEELCITTNTQPCLFTVDLAAAYALRENGIEADGVAGFSLGELAASVYSGMLSFEDGFRLVCQRAEIMENNSLPGGTMAAVLKLSAKTVEQICSETGFVYPVNYNSEGQTVIAGEQSKIEEAAKKIEAAGGRAIRLSVGGAFHSPFMENAYKNFSKVLSDYTFSKPKVPLYSNVTALLYGDDNAAELLGLQLKSPVLWQKTIENMVSDGYGVFIEAGVGTTLINLIKRINPDVRIFNTNTLKEMEAVCAANDYGFER